MISGIRQDQEEEEGDMKDSPLISVKLSDIQLKWLPILEYEENRPGISSGKLPRKES
jgi:hypothetical protein